MTITDYISRAARQLEGAGLEDPRREARMLLLEGAGLTLAEQYAHPGRELSPDMEERLLAALERRSSREPLSSIFASAFFCGKNAQHQAQKKSRLHGQHQAQQQSPGWSLQNFAAAALPPGSLCSGSLSSCRKGLRLCF